MKMENENKKFVVSTSKIIPTIFTYSFEESEIRTDSLYDDDRNLIEEYYVEFKYEKIHNNTYKIKIISSNKDNLKFTIHELLLYQMLINNARQLAIEDNYFISMRKLREMRGLKSNSSATYLKYEEAIKSLEQKTLVIVPVSIKYADKRIKSKMLTLSNIRYKGSRIVEFNYSFGNLKSQFINSNQKGVVEFNPFNFNSKSSFCIQAVFHLIRLISINTSKVKERNFSVKKMLEQLYTVDTKGLFTNISYYEFIAKSQNKQSDNLDRIYSDIILILSQMKKSKYISQFSLSERKTFKYLKDDEVKIFIKF